MYELGANYTIEGVGWVAGFAMEELVGVSKFEIHTSLESTVAVTVKVFVDISVKKRNNVSMETKSNFDARDEFWKSSSSS